MAKGKVLTESDVAILKEIVSEHRHRSGTTLQRPRVELNETVAPETYIAFTPAGGISAMVEGPDTGTAFGGGDKPGYDDCTIYQVVNEQGTPELVLVEGLSKRVYNLSGLAVGGASWIIVAREKFGAWIAVSAAGSGGSGGPSAFLAKWIRFKLPSVLTTANTSVANCVVEDFWEGSNPGATVTVFNPPADSNYQFDGITDGRGLAVYDDIDNKYWIVELQRTARWIRFRLVATLAVTDENQANVPVETFWQGVSPGSTVTVHNVSANVNYIFSGSTGFKGLASYNPESSNYIIVQMQC